MRTDGPRFLALSLAVLASLQLVSRADAQEAMLNGRVVDPDGKPIPKAIIAGRLQYPGAIQKLGTSDEQGVFAVSLPQGTDPDRVWMFVRAPGFGVADGDGEDFASYSERRNVLQTFTLRPSVPIHGRLLDSEGNPVAGVRVRPIQVWKYGQDRRPTIPEAIQSKRSLRSVLDHGKTSIIFDIESELLLPWSETDADGRFTIDSIEPNSIARLFCAGPKTAGETFCVRTDDAETVALSSSSADPTSPKMNLYAHAEFEHTVAPSIPVRGFVTRADNGLPLAGVTVTPWRLPGLRIAVGEERLLAAETNSLGSFELIGLSKETDRLDAIPPSDGDLIAVERNVTFELDQPLQLDFELPIGVRVHGQVTDATTGKPVPGRVAAYSFSDNPHLKEFEPSDLSSNRHSATVDENGEYEILMLSGAGLLGFRASTEIGDQYQRGGGAAAITHHRDDLDDGHIIFRTRPHSLTAVNEHRVVEINVSETANEQPFDFTVGAPRIDVPLEIVREPGGPTQVYYSNESPDGGAFSLVTFDFMTQKMERGTIRFFEGGTGRVSQARSSDHTLAGWTYVRPTDELARIDLKPAATVKGQVLDAEGKAVAGASISTPYDHDSSKMQGQIPSQPNDVGYSPHTDEEGRFQIFALAPDLKLTVQISVYTEDRVYLKERRVLFEDLMLEAGETLDLGVLHLNELPDALK